MISSETGINPISLYGAAGLFAIMRYCARFPGITS
jgi:hypothetical protein